MKNKTQIGAQLYTLRDQCKADFAGTLKKVSELGYRGIQVSGYHEKTPKEIKRMADDNGLSILATHIRLPELENNLAAVLDDHEILGCRYIAIPNLPKERRETRAQWMELARIMDDIATKAAQRGFVIMYHNHAFEFETTFDGKHAIELIYEHAPRLQSEIDTYWVWKGGLDPAQFLSRFKNRAPMLHVKDADKQDGSFAEVGSGQLNWTSILQTAEEVGVQGYLVEQDVCKRSPFDCLKSSLDFLRQQGLE